MSSSRQREANRRNAQASTGPRTPAGKSRAAQNARRHGLSVSVLADPAIYQEVSQSAQMIAGDAASLEILALAHRVAEAQIDLVRVRNARHALLSRNLADPAYRSPVGARDLRALRKILNKVGAAGALAPEHIDILDRQSKGGKKLTVILVDCHKQLARLDRYERQALSRRKFAVRALDEARRLARDASSG